MSEKSLSEQFQFLADACEQGIGAIEQLTRDNAELTRRLSEAQEKIAAQRESECLKDQAIDRALQRAQAAESRCAELREALWVCAEHNELHFGANHSTVIQARATLTKEAKHG